MSNALALAGVTAVLKDLLDNAMIDVGPTVGTVVTVSSLAPDLMRTTAADVVPRINLFLHQVTHNSAYRNVDLPGRDARGQRTGNPPLALDLHYLLTAYGAEELQAEVLLGYALQLLHENPVLSRTQIRDSLNANPISSVSLLPSAYQALRAADLAEQMEMLKITPASMSSEEMSRLWSALQAPYRPTAAFQVSVVLIQPQRPVISPLAVLRRGELDQGVRVTPDLLPPYPTLESVIAAGHETPSVLRLGDFFKLKGHHLGGTARTLVLHNDHFGITHELPLSDATDEQEISLSLVKPVALPPLPDLADVLPAGQYRIELHVLRPGDVTPRASNALPVMLAPAITSLPPVAMARSAANVLSITLRCEPLLRVGQAVSLLMDSQEAAAQAFSTSTAQPTFKFNDAPPAGGKPLLRLKVDGIESVHIDRTRTPPVFFDHRITLPA